MGWFRRRINSYKFDRSMKKKGYVIKNKKAWNSGKAVYGKDYYIRKKKF